MILPSFVLAFHDWEMGLSSTRLIEKKRKGTILTVLDYFMLLLFNHIDSFVTGWTVAHRLLIHWISQAGILEWVAYPTPGDSPHPRIEPMSPESPLLQVDSLMLSLYGNFKSEFPHVVIKSLQTRKKILEIN